MEVLKEGKGELLGWHDPDEARDWVLKNKSRELKDKTMSTKEAVSRFVCDEISSPAAVLDTSEYLWLLSMKLSDRRNAT